MTGRCNRAEGCAVLQDDLAHPQRLALTYAAPRARAVTLALFALDARLGAVVRARREPLATQLRLAWWRDMLERPSAQWPQGEPVLEALRVWRDPASLAPLASGWEALLAEDLSPDVIAQFVDARGQSFDALAAELGALGGAEVVHAGRLWALADLAANLCSGPEKQLVINYGRTLSAPGRLSASLRPLAVLARLAERALAQGGTPLLDGPRAAVLALRTGLTGQ